VVILPRLDTRYGVSVDGLDRDAATFAGTDGSTTNPSRLIDSGRFMQRVDVPAVSYGDESLSGSVQLAAMPRHFVLTHRASRSGPTASLGVQITLEGLALEAFPETTWLDEDRAVTVHDGAGEGWTFVLPDGQTTAITRGSNGGIVFERTASDVPTDQAVTLSVLAIPSTAGDAAQQALWLEPQDTVSVSSEQLQRDGTGTTGLAGATWDTERGLWVVSLADLTALGAPSWPDWSDADNHTWYNRFRLVLENHSDTDVAVPLALDGGGGLAFYITGGSPLLRDTAGEPIGAPIQISKNWHESPYWYHLYSHLTVPPGSTELELTVAHARWGETYAAAHAQLSLVGWGTNQQWDESSLGAWGESVTYDPDMTLQRSMVDDVRPFLVDSAGEWGWTGNVGGASFLVYEDADGTDHRLARLRSHYAATGPNLTDVQYAGVSTDGRIAAHVTTQLGRTDDLVRVWYHLTYTFLEDVAYDRLAFFQVAADGYGDNGFRGYAYGSADAVAFQGTVPDHGTTGYASDADRGIALTGDAPWVMLYDSEHTTGSLPEHGADVGYVIRHFEAVLGDETITTPHVNLVRTYNGKWSQLAFELGLPDDPSARVVPAGSVVRATVEYLVPPADKDSYYGESDHLLALPEEVFSTPELMQGLAAGNALQVDAAVGTVLRPHPVELQAAVGEHAVELTLTGGLGYVPLTVRGLSRPDGWRLEQADGESWVPVDQAVEGNDYWQAGYDEAADTFSLTWNLPNRGTETYRLVR
jgi:hypothetical protein